MAASDADEGYGQPPVLVHAPLGDDAAAIGAEVRACGLALIICQASAEIDAIITPSGPEAALMVVVSEEGAGTNTGEIIGRARAAEPSWARLPVIFLVSNSRRPPPACRMLESEPHAPPFVVLERPVRPAVLRKVLRALAEARRRQFETRDLLDRLRREEEHRSFLLSELRHRTRNSLAVLQSLFSLSVRRADDLDEFADAFRARLRSLSDAHNRLAETDHRAADLLALLEAHVLPYAADPQQLNVQGPSVRIRERVAFDLALVLHELATNAAKYGALSAPEGRVEVEWWIETRSGRVGIVWREEGGPPVEEPEGQGLGRTVIERFLAESQSTHLVFEREGVVWSTFILPNDWERGDAAS